LYSRVETLAELFVFAHCLVGRNRDFAIGLVSQARPPDLDLPVDQRHHAGLRAMPADVTCCLAGRARPGDLLGAQYQDCLQCLQADFMNHRVHHRAGALDLLDEGEEDLAIALAEFLDDRR
jgi:hypothetical protein